MMAAVVAAAAVVIMIVMMLSNNTHNQTRIAPTPVTPTREAAHWYTLVSMYCMHVYMNVCKCKYDMRVYVAYTCAWGKRGARCSAMRTTTTHARQHVHISHKTPLNCSGNDGRGGEERARRRITMQLNKIQESNDEIRTLASRKEGV